MIKNDSYFRRTILFAGFFMTLFLSPAAYAEFGHKLDIGNGLDAYKSIHYGDLDAATRDFGKVLKMAGLAIETDQGSADDEIDTFNRGGLPFAAYRSPTGKMTMTPDTLMIATRPAGSGGILHGRRLDRSAIG